MTVVRLVDRRPSLGPEELIRRFVPPKRFADVRFDTFLPSPQHPSQADAQRRLMEFAHATGTGEPSRRWRRRGGSVTASAPARYLDGGFGVGKTHLLASLWHEGPSPKAFLTFAELTAVIGFLGMEQSIEVFGRHRLLCIDEFELDDVANTLMAVTFLRAVIADAKVAATSNTLPDRLGEGRFAADDFRREIAAISEHFEVVRIDGPDYRARQRVAAEPFTDPDLDQWRDARAGSTTVAGDEFDELLTHLRRVHPVQIQGLLAGVDAVAIRGLHPIANQGDALLFVHLVDELYDAEIPVAASGCAVEDLFPASYRAGGYRKKYGRCESRMLAMLGESGRSPEPAPNPPTAPR